MKNFELASIVWWRAQGIYALLNILGAVLFPIWSLVTRSAEAGGELFGLAVFSVGFALVCGLPAWIAMSLVMAVLGKPAARRGLLGFAMLIVGLLATKAALYFGFDVVLGGTGIGSGDPLVLTFSILAYASMFISAFTLRSTIARHTSAISDAEAPQHPTTTVQQ